MKVTDTDITEVKPYERNPRNNAGAVDKVAASIVEFGFRQPIVVDEAGVIIAGHTRYLAACQLDLDTVPVHVATGLSPAQVAAYRLADNRVAEEASWDEGLLALELADIDGDIELSLTGFDLDEITGVIARNTTGKTDPDTTPEPPAVPVSQPGDIWQLGNHRVICGDSTDADTVAAVLNGVEPHLMVTDPPYGVEYDASWRADAGVNKNKRKMGAVQNDERCDWREAWLLFAGDVAYIWHAGRHASEVQESIESCDFTIRSQVIWAKDRFALSRGDYHWQHEPCWYAVRNKRTGNWVGDRSQSTLWSIRARDDSGVGHSTQKPVECMRRPILNNSKPGDAVYDPFLGSGTTVIAAEQEGRICYGIELNPAYVDIIVTRWQDFTGESAALDGVPFNEIATQRKAA